MGLKTKTWAEFSTLETVDGFIDVTAARGRREILWRLLRGDIREADSLVRNYKFTQQYYRDLVNTTKEYREVLQEMRKASPEGLELLNVQAIQYFKEGELDEEEVAAKLNVPAAYIMILSLIKD